MGDPGSLLCIIMEDGNPGHADEAKERDRKQTHHISSVKMIGYIDIDMRSDTHELE
jgi:hypothetical protein